MDPDVYSEEREEGDDPDEEDDIRNDQNNENNDEIQASKAKKKDSPTTKSHRIGDETVEENTMDVLDEEEEEEEEEELNNQQTGKYSLRERKPPIQRLPLYGKSNLLTIFLPHSFPQWM